MTLSIAQINTSANADTFDILYARFNAMANAFSTVVLTSAANSSGSQTTGNTVLNGIFQSTILTTTNGLRGGNVSASANLVISSNVVVTNGNFIVSDANGSTVVNSTSITVNTAVVSNLVVSSLTLGSSVAIGSYVDAYFSYATSNTSQQVIDTFDITAFRSAEYMLQVTDSTANNVQVSKILLISTGLDSFMTEYAQLAPNNALGTFTTSVNSTAVILSFQPALSNVNVIKGFKKMMAI